MGAINGYNFFSKSLFGDGIDYPYSIWSASYHAYVCFHPSSVLVPIPFPHLSKLDHIHNTLVLCIWTNHKDCQPMAYHGSQEEYGRCMIQSFQDCMDNPLYKDDLDYHVGKKCKLYYNEKETKSVFRLGFCLIDFFLH